MVFWKIVTWGVSLVPNPSTTAPAIETINIDLKDILTESAYSPFTKENISKHLMENLENDWDSLNTAKESVNIEGDRLGSKEILNTISKLKSIDDFPVKIEYPDWYPNNLPIWINMGRDKNNIYIAFHNDSIIRSFAITPETKLAKWWVLKINRLEVWDNWEISLIANVWRIKTRDSQRMMELLFKLLDKDIDNLPDVTVRENKSKLLKKP